MQGSGARIKRQAARIVDQLAKAAFKGGHRLALADLPAVEHRLQARHQQFRRR